MKALLILPLILGFLPILVVSVKLGSSRVPPHATRATEHQPPEALVASEIGRFIERKGVVEEVVRIKVFGVWISVAPVESSTQKLLLWVIPLSWAILLGASIVILCWPPKAVSSF